MGCDEFTRDFLGRLNIVVPKNAAFPGDPHEIRRQEILSRMKATRPSQPDFSLKKFLENDRRVLRFYCVWDDSTSVLRDLRHMVVNYFLSDDTIEIRETIPANSGRESNSLFLRRCRLPKHPHNSRIYGHPDERSEEYFSERDLMLGSVIHLYGRPFVICDCDEFTKSYYKEHYGVEDFDPVVVENYEMEETLPFFDVAAHHEQEATLVIGNDQRIKKDFRKMMTYDGIILRFLGVLDSTKQVERDRKFVISFYLADDTISVFEPPARNSGVLGGKFLEQKRLKKLNGEYYESKDFFVGKECVM